MGVDLKEDRKGGEILDTGYFQALLPEREMRK